LLQLHQAGASAPRPATSGGRLFRRNDRRKNKGWWNNRRIPFPTMFIELAPNHKRGLTLAHPLMLASVSATDARIGATVTLPLTLHARGGAPLPRVVEIPGACLVRTGAANPGLSRTLRDSRLVASWAESSAPIIVALAAQGVSDWPAMSARLERVEGVGGIELQLNPALDAINAIRATRAATELPILAKLDLDNAVAIAADCLAAGANALVIGRAPRGMIMLDDKAWYGRLYGPASKPFALRCIAKVAALKLDAPLVGCGGIHSVEDAREFLSAGAAAVELDTAAWIDPSVVKRMALGLEDSA
jgi:dihydroorotate dehydrogenase (NAD+) catalytic subunit